MAKRSSSALPSPGLPPAETGEQIPRHAAAQTVPPSQGPAQAQGGDPFAEFEGDDDALDADVTHINQDNLIAEASTTILQESNAPTHLLVEAGKDQGKRFFLGPGQTTVGRSVDNDVILTDPSVSRRHIRVEGTAAGFHLYDLGSGNGTLLNGARVFDSRLLHGDRIEIGESVLCFDGPAFPRPANAPAVLPGSQPSAGFVAPPPPDASGPQAPPAVLPGAPPSAVAPAAGHAPAVGGANASVPVAATVRAEAQPPAPRARKGASRVWLFVAMGAVTLCAVVGAGAAIWIAQSTETATDQVPVEVDDLYRRGVLAVELKRYEQAQELFSRILAFDPGHDQARRELAKAEAAIEHQGYLADAEAALGRRDWRATNSHADKIPRDSRFARQASRLMRDAAVGHSEEALAAGDLDEAKRRADYAFGIDPTSRIVRELVAKVNAALGGEGGRPVSGSRPGRPSPGQQPDRRTGRPPSGATVRRDGTRRRNDYRQARNGSGDRGSQTGSQRTRPSGGESPSQPGVSRAAVTQLLAEARRYGTRSTAGCQAVRRARRGASGNSEVASLWQECTGHAQSLLDSAQSKPAAVKRHMLHQVIGMVGSSHGLFARAQEMLRALPQDEDE